MPLDDLVDIISQDILEDPVIAEDGYTYSRRSLLWWIAFCAEQDVELTSPITDQPMGPSMIDNDHADQYLEELDEKLSPYRRCSQLGELAIHQPMSSIKVLANMLRCIDGIDLELSPETVTYTPPKIIAIGDRGGGKSALLERITMMSCFPLGDDMGTVIPIHVHLRNAAIDSPTIVSITVVDSESGAPAGETQVIPCLDSASWHIQDAIRLMLRSGTQNEEYNDSICATYHIVVEVLAPCVPSVDIIDLPGVSDVDSSSVSRRRVEAYLSSNPQAIYLVVLDAKSDLKESLVMDLVKTYCANVCEPPIDRLST